MIENLKEKVLTEYRLKNEGKSEVNNPTAIIGGENETNSKTEPSYGNGSSTGNCLTGLDLAGSSFEGAILLKGKTFLLAKLLKGKLFSWRSFLREKLFSWRRRKLI